MQFIAGDFLFEFKNSFTLPRLYRQTDALSLRKFRTRCLKVVSVFHTSSGLFICFSPMCGRTKKAFTYTDSPLAVMPNCADIFECRKAKQQ